MKRKLKNVIRDLIISNNLFFKPRKGNRIIIFHEIYDPILFREKILWLNARFKIVPVLDLMTSGSTEEIAITFDDGYKSWFTEVLPFFKEYKIPATFFVNTGFLDLKGDDKNKFVKSNLKRNSKNLVPLSKSQLKEIAEIPFFDFGCHTHNHVDFSQIDHSNYETEIDLNRSLLENITGKAVKLFAYPFGQEIHAPKVLQKYLEKNNFSFAFTIIPGFIKQRKNDFLVNRDSLELWQTNKVWDRWLHGAYDSLVLFKNKVYRSVSH